MKARFSKRITKYNYPKGKDARKDRYGWDNIEKEETEDKLIEVESIRKQFEEILKLADRAEYEMIYFDLRFKKIPDKSLRKEVRFELKVEND